MNFREIVKTAEKFTVDNSPLILTVVGATGAVTTAILAAKASWTAATLIHEENAWRAIQTEPRDEMTLKESFNLVWKEYIPPVGVGVLTVTAIVSANHIGTRRAAALAAAYSVSEKSFNEYKERVTEKLGVKKEQTVRDDIAQDQVRRNPTAGREIVLTGGGDILCHEAFTGRYFRSSIEDLRRAENEINHRINRDTYASLSDFYDVVGLEHTSMSDEVGWNGDNLLDLQFSTVLSDKNEPCLSINYSVEPVRKFFRFH